jgi:hypothetical protein
MYEYRIELEIDEQYRVWLEAERLREEYENVNNVQRKNVQALRR